MDIRRFIHSSLSIALIPSIVLLGAPGLTVLVLWVVTWPANLICKRPHLDPAMILLSCAGIFVTALHASSFQQSIVVIAAGVLLTWLLLQLVSTITKAQCLQLAVGAAMGSMLLATLAALQAFASGFGQIHPASHHPNLSAAMALALAAASAMGLTASGALTQLSERPSLVPIVSVLGVLAAVPTVILTGSRSGLLGLGAAVIGLVLIMIWHQLLRSKPSAGSFGSVASMALILIGTQLLAFSPSQVARGGWTELAGAPIPGLYTGSPTDDIRVRFAELLNPLMASGTRVANWRIARQLVSQQPLTGYGFNQALEVFSTASRNQVLIPIDHPHNGLLLATLQGGVVLLAAIIIAVTAFGFRLSEAISSAKGPLMAPSIVLAIGFGLLIADRFDVLIVDWQVAAPLSMAVIGVLTSTVQDP